MIDTNQNRRDFLNWSFTAVSSAMLLKGSGSLGSITSSAASFFRKPGSGLNAPSMPFPESIVAKRARKQAYAVCGVGEKGKMKVVTFKSPSDFKVTLFERAITFADKIVFGPGIYNIEGMKPQKLDNIIFEGAGKYKTVLQGGFTVDRNFINSGSDVIGTISGTVEVYNLTFKGIRALFVGGRGTNWQRGKGVSEACDIGSLQSIAKTVGENYPVKFHDAFRLNNVAFIDCGRLCHMRDAKKTIDAGIFDVYLHNCDFINMWYIACCEIQGSTSNWSIFNCLFENIMHRDTDEHYGWRYVGLGFRLTQNLRPNKFSAIEAKRLKDPDDSLGKTDNWRMEHCTFNGVTSIVGLGKGQRTDVSMDAYIVRGMNFRKDCWIKHCYFRNIGWDKDGNNQVTVYRGMSAILYPKGIVRVENTIIDRACIGLDGLWNNKGYLHKFMYEKYPNGPYSFMYQFKNIWVRGMEKIPRSVHKNGVDHDFVPKAIFFTGAAYNMILDNVRVDDSITEHGILNRMYGESSMGGIRGKCYLKNITARNIEVTDKNNNAPLYINHGWPETELTMENIKGELVGTKNEWGGALFQIKGYDDWCKLGTIQLKNAWLDTSKLKPEKAALVYAEGTAEATFSPTPSGTIVGASKPYALAGDAVENIPLENKKNPEQPTGADLGWVFNDDAKIVGCDRRHARQFLKRPESDF